MTDSTLNTPPNDKDTRDFLKRVVPWPASPEEGYINVHWHLPGKPFRGRSTQNIDELVEAVAALKASDPSNIYFCLSQQRRNGGSRGSTGKNDANI
jgi:hypothetical protein